MVSETAVSDETDAAPAAAEDAPVYLRLDHYGNAAQLKASLVLPEGAKAAVCGENGAVLADTDVAVSGTKLLISAKDGVTVRCYAVNPDPIDLFDADFDSSNFPSDFSGNPIWGGFKFFKCAHDGSALAQVPAACGKTGDKDQAVRITSNVNIDQQIGINPAKPTRGTFVLEGSILAKDYNGARVWQGKAAANDEAYASAWLDNILELKSTGQVYCLGKLTNYKYPLNQWVNYAVEMFAGTNRFVLYINGDKVKEDVFNFKNAKEGQLFDSLSYFKWYQKADVPLTEDSKTYETCTTLADDFKIYQGMYDMDAARIGEHADTYQLSIADGVRTMSEIPAGTTASELKRQVTVSEGSSIHIFDADLQAERADGETVAEGDQVVLTAPNGRARRYYTASLKAAELLITKPELYKDNVKADGFMAGDTLRIQAGVENHRDIPQDAVMIAGLFEDGRLIGVEKAEETGISNTEAIRNLVIEAFAVPPGVDGSKCELRVFLFEDFQSLRPLTDMTPFYHK